MEEVKDHIFMEEDKYGIGNNIYDFDYLQYLGGGNTYHYAKVKSKLNNKIYVMKIIPNIKLEKYKRIEKKLYILRLLDHPNILKYYSSFIHNNNYYIVMEYAESGNLKNYIKLHKIIDKNIEENKLNKIFYQSMSALKYLHEQEYLHRNISTSNIFITKDGDIKLGGFDYLCNINDVNEKIIKPVDNIWCYIMKNESSFKADFYCLGLVFYNLRYLKPKQIILPEKDKYNSRIFTIMDIDEENSKSSKKTLKPEYLLMKSFNKDFNQENLNKKIIKNYNKNYGENWNTSIESVYFSLIYLFQNQKIIMGAYVDSRKINVNEEFNSNGAISQSFKVKDLTQLREILIENNQAFNKYKDEEIPPEDLIKFIIKQLHIENNYKNYHYSKIYSLNNEKKDSKNYNNLIEKGNGERNQINRALILSDYESAYDQYFNSIISNKNKGLYGTFEIKDICQNCDETSYYFESFYYITLDLDSTEGSINISDIFEDNKDEIIKYKYCQNCKNITKHNEIKSIYKYPCRLVILIKNYTQRASLMTKQTIINDNYYLCIGTINLNKSKEKYEYSYYTCEKAKENHIWTHTNKQITTNNFNNNNIVALFCLYIGDNNIQ